MEHLSAITIFVFSKDLLTLGVLEQGNMFAKWIQGLSFSFANREVIKSHYKKITLRRKLTGCWKTGIKPITFWSNLFFNLLKTTTSTRVNRQVGYLFSAMKYHISPQFLAGMENSNMYGTVSSVSMTVASENSVTQENVIGVRNLIKNDRHVTYRIIRDF